MTTREALRALGVREDTLTAAQQERLDEDGYLVLPAIFTAGEAARFAARLDELAAEEGERAGCETHQEAGSVRLSNLIDKDPLFDVTFTHPQVLAAVARVLRNDLRLSSLNSRAALPGQGLQGLHADWEAPVPPGEYAVCNSIWLLDAFTGENGATRVVPGSHRSRRMPQDEMPDPSAPHPGEVLLQAPAGTVIVFNAHVWHGGTRNRTPRLRRAMHAYFCRRDQPQQTNQRHFLRPETRARLSEVERFILDV
jgi:ectoine hydroxylase-related dioxygenase (phytanoyl-CoA dioxygenase family)